jgi:hypothetical protein
MPQLQSSGTQIVSHRQTIFDLFYWTVYGNRLQFLDVNNAAKLLDHQLVAFVVESTDALVEKSTIFD